MLTFCNRILKDWLWVDFKCIHIIFFFQNEVATRLRFYYAKIEDKILSEEEIEVKKRLDSDLLQIFKLDGILMKLLDIQLRNSNTLPDKDNANLIMAIILLNGYNNELTPVMLESVLLKGKITLSLELLNELVQVSAVCSFFSLTCSKSKCLISLWGYSYFLPISF